MANLIMFCILAVIILGSAIVCVTTKRIMRAATFLLFVLFGVAGIYFLLGYTFLGAAQISIYAGGITMLYIFAIQLVSKRTLQGLQESFSLKKSLGGVLVALVGLVMFLVIFAKNEFIGNVVDLGLAKEVSMHEIGTTLIGTEKGQYALPFEFISVFLLACIIGGVMIARKEDKK